MIEDQRAQERETISVLLLDVVISFAQPDDAVCGDRGSEIGCYGRRQRCLKALAERRRVADHPGLGRGRAAREDGEREGDGRCEPRDGSHSGGFTRAGSAAATEHAAERQDEERVGVGLVLVLLRADLDDGSDPEAAEERQSRGERAGQVGGDGGRAAGRWRTARRRGSPKSVFFG